MKKRDNDLEEVLADERAIARAKARSEAELTKVADYHAQVIIAKGSNVAVAVVWTDEHGTHIRGITDALEQDLEAKNYVWGTNYVEMLAKQIQREDEAES
jgi:hypothetical protein